MCRQLQVSNQFGYKEAFVLKNVSYVWRQKCESFSNLKEFPDIKFMTSTQGQFFQNTKDAIIPGNQLMMADYLSLGLNMTMNFVHSNPTPGEDPNTALYFEINGDIFLNYPFLLAYNLISNRFGPVSSPIYDTMAGGILSLKKHKCLSVSQIIGEFNVKVYLLLLLCTLFVAAFLKWCGQKSKICFRTFHRQFIEMFWLITFNPRAFGIIREKNCVVRIVIGASILTGFVMRKCFGCQLNTVWMLESFDYVSDMNESLKAHPEIQRILTNFMGGTILSSSWDLYEKPYDVPLYDNREEVMILGDLLEGDSVYFYVFDVLKQLKAKYPFLPIQLSRLNGFFGQTAIYYFPIYQHSPHFTKICKRMQLAFDHGIYSASCRDLERMSIHQSKATNDYKRVYKLYKGSIFWISIKKHSENKNILQFAFYILFVGFTRATLSLIFEVYKANCFGSKIKPNEKY